MIIVLLIPIALTALICFMVFKPRYIGAALTVAFCVILMMVGIGLAIPAATYYGALPAIADYVLLILLPLLWLIRTVRHPQARTVATNDYGPLGPRADWWNTVSERSDRYPLPKRHSRFD